MSEIFLELTIILSVVVILLGLMKFFRQPLIIAYILAGTLLSLVFPTLFHNNHVIEFLSDFGILFLLFGVGIELNPNVIKNIGKNVVISGFLQVLITGIFSFLVAYLLGFGIIPSIYLAIGLSFSSTIVTLKLIGDIDKLDSTFGKISTGILITQDLIVMLVLLVLSTLRQISSAGILAVLGILAVKIVFLGGLLRFGKKYLLNRFLSKIASSSEFLFLFSITWAMLMAAVFNILGFSSEIGALLAGVLLSDSEYRFEVLSRIKSLKDFFLVMFFVLLGSRLDLGAISSWLLVILFSLLVLFVKPLITYYILIFKGYSKKYSFLSSISLGQISEFSFLLFMMGVSQGYLSSDLINFITLIGLITIAISSYFIKYGEKIYEFVKGCKILNFVKAKKQHFVEGEKNFEYLLVGYGRFGKSLFRNLSDDKKKKFLICDNNPDMIYNMKKEGLNYIFGDVGELDFLQELNIGKFKLIISSSKDFESNLSMLEYIKINNFDTKVIMVANYEYEIEEYSKYPFVTVIFPHSLSAEYVKELLE